MKVFSVNDAVLACEIQAATKPATPPKEGSPAVDAFANYQPTGVQDVGEGRSKRDAIALDVTIKSVSMNVNRLSPEVRQKLDEIAAKIQDLDVQKIEITGYSLMFREMGAPRASAAKEYLATKGVDQNLLFTKGKGPGFSSDAYLLGRDNCVVVKVFGTLKETVPVYEASAAVAERSVPHLIA